MPAYLFHPYTERTYNNIVTVVFLGNKVNTIGNYAFNQCRTIKTVKYAGSKSQWNNMEIGKGNDSLTNADIIFNYTPVVDNPSPGDLNADGKLNSRDVIAMIKLVLTPNHEINEICDLNNDGKINSRDVIALMKLVLSQA